MALPISFRWDEAFIARIDGARGDVPRSAFVRRAVEQALSEAKELGDPEQADPGSVSSSEGVRSAAPAEQPRVDHYRQLAARSSVQAKRGTGPRPKGGK